MSNCDMKSFLFGFKALLVGFLWLGFFADEPTEAPAQSWEEYSHDEYDTKFYEGLKLNAH